MIEEEPRPGTADLMGQVLAERSLRRGGSYCLPIFERASSRTLFNVNVARTTSSAG